MSRLEVGYRYRFNELKPDDQFAMNGLDHEKLSGNMADVIEDHGPDEVPTVLRIVEVDCDTLVYLYQEG